MMFLCNMNSLELLWLVVAGKAQVELMILTMAELHERPRRPRKWAIIQHTGVLELTIN